MDLNFKAQGQRLVRTDCETVAENSMNYLYAVFELDGNWTGFGIKAVFEHRGSSYYSLVEGGRCAVPAEVIRWGGFSVSVIGTDGENNVRITSSRVKVAVEAGPDLGAENASSPTLSELEQIESSVNSLRNRLDSMPELTEERDPTVPDWAKAETKPVYTAAEVGADPKGSASERVDAHNKATAAHSDIRRQLRYSLIKRVEITDTDVANGCSAVDVEVEGSGIVFDLKALTCFCSFPAASAATAIDLLIKPKDGTGYVSVHRRTQIINTSARYYRVSLRNEGYWTGNSVLTTEPGGTNDEYGSYAKNSVSANAVGIRVATGGAVFPAGSVIEIWGVKS